MRILCATNRVPGVHLGQEQREPLLAEARNLLQRLVPLQMPVGVVVPLEIVQVQQQEREGAPVAAGPLVELGILQPADLTGLGLDLRFRVPDGLPEGLLIQPSSSLP